MRRLTMFMILLYLINSINIQAMNLDGFIIYVVNMETGSAIVRYDLATSQEIFLTDGAWYDLNPVLSPTGSQVVFSSNRHGNEDIFVINTDGTNLRQLTISALPELYPSWSPDESQIAYVVSQNRNTSQIFIIDIDGTNNSQISDGITWDTSPAWSPNGEFIAFISQRNDFYNLYLMSPSGYNVSQLTFGENSIFYPTWSPDSSKIAFRSNGGKIFVINADGTELRQVTDDGDIGAFSWLNNERIIYQAPVNMFSSSILSINLDGTERTVLDIEVSSEVSYLNLSQLSVGDDISSISLIESNGVSISGFDPLANGAELPTSGGME